jgi:hypothetical protein
LYSDYQGIRIPGLGGITSVILAEHNACCSDDGNLRLGLLPYPLHCFYLSKKLLHLPLKDTRKPRQPRHIMARNLNSSHVCIHLLSRFLQWISFVVRSAL